MMRVDVVHGDFMKTERPQEFIIAAATGITGVFIIAMTWSEFLHIAKEHPGVRAFSMGLMLLFMAAANLSKGLKRRSWLKQMKTLGSTTTESTLSSEGAPPDER